MIVDFIAQKPGARIRSIGRNRSIFPLIFLRKELKRHGIWIRFHEYTQKSADLAGQILCLDSRVFTNERGRVDQSTIQKLSRWRNRYEWIVWFDNCDSTGTPQFEVLPYVDRYAKKQLLRDRKLYMKPFYGGRIYTDFVHNKYGICDTGELEEPEPIQFENDIRKLVLSWNLSYSDYRSENHWQRYINYGLGFCEPIFYCNQDRTNQLQARFGTAYTSRTIAHHRESFLNLAKDLGRKSLIVTYGYISLRIYKHELRHFLAILSPFGWGEICFRDFEAMQNACALLKPSIEHLETWPDLLKDGETYIGLSWHAEAAKIQIEGIFNTPEYLLDIGLQGQRAFKNIWGKQGKESFAEHFLSIIGPSMDGNI